jgi:hypothetical protein
MSSSSSSSSSSSGGSQGNRLGLAGWEEMDSLRYVCRSPVTKVAAGCACRKLYRDAAVICDSVQCENFASFTECGQCSKDRCRNKRFQRREWKKLDVLEVRAARRGGEGSAGRRAVRGEFEPRRPARVCVSRGAPTMPATRVQTPGKGRGLFAAERIRKGEFVIEYVGEVIDDVEYRRRMEEAEVRGGRDVGVGGVECGGGVAGRGAWWVGRGSGCGLWELLWVVVGRSARGRRTFT